MIKLHKSPVVLTLAIAFFSVACSIDAGTTSELKSDLPINQKSGDIKLLSFRSVEEIGDSSQPALGGLPLDRSTCPDHDDLGNSPGSGASTKDCSKQVQKLLDGAPLVGEFIIGERSGKCEVLEVTTLITIPALENETFRGIGLYFNGKEILVPMKKLYVQFQHRMNGLPFVEHKFYLQGSCFGQGGNTGSIISRSFSTKPFAEYLAAGKTYRTWEDIAWNHTINPGKEPSSIDRRNELLR